MIAIQLHALPRFRGSAALAETMQLYFSSARSVAQPLLAEHACVQECKPKFVDCRPTGRYPDRISTAKSAGTDLALVIDSGRITGNREVMPGHKSVIGQMKSR
jgi:hypothetical protein